MVHKANFSFQSDGTPPKDEISASGNPILLPATLFLIAIALRIYGLDNGPWHDEIRMYVSYLHLPFTKLLSTYDSENQHPFYTLLAWLSVRSFGQYVWAMRLPAVLFGVASICATYRLGRFVSNQREALLSAALLTFSYYHIWFSQNARGYTGLLFWTITSSTLFLRGIRDVRSKTWLIYALCAALGVYTHITMIFVVLSQFLILLMMVFKKEVKLPDGRRIVGWFCLSGIFTLLLYAPMIPQLVKHIGMKTTVSIWNSPLWTLSELNRGMHISFGNIFMVLAALLVLCAGIWSFAVKNRILVYLFLLPAILGSAITLAMGHPLWPRFFFFEFGLGTILVVRGIVQAANWLTKAPAFKSLSPNFAATAVCILFILLSSVSVLSVYAPKQDYEEALNFIQESKQPGDSIVTVGLAAFAYREYFQADWQEIRTVNELDSVRLKSKRTWVLYAFPLHVQQEYPEIMRRVRDESKVIREFEGTLNGGTVFVCRFDGPAC